MSSQGMAGREIGICVLSLCHHWPGMFTGGKQLENVPVPSLSDHPLLRSLCVPTIWSS